MLNIYEIDSNYIDYLAKNEPHFYQNKKPEQNHTRKYIGIVFKINGFDYFAPLTSYKPKHDHMKDSVEFIKLDHKGAINLNCMFPVSLKNAKMVNIQNEDPKYRDLLNREVLWIRSKEKTIKTNAKILYWHKIKYGNSTTLGKRCNDFKALEKLSKQYDKQNNNNGPQK